jgi:hypothetical protein
MKKQAGSIFVEASDRLYTSCKQGTRQQGIDTRVMPRLLGTLKAGWFVKYEIGKFSIAPLHAIDTEIKTFRIELSEGINTQNSSHANLPTANQGTAFGSTAETL